jgi:hypothetical protein
MGFGGSPLKKPSGEIACGRNQPTGLYQAALSGIVTFTRWQRHNLGYRKAAFRDHDLVARLDAEQVATQIGFKSSHSGLALIRELSLPDQALHVTIMVFAGGTVNLPSREGGKDGESRAPG